MKFTSTYQQHINSCIMYTVTLNTRVHSSEWVSEYEWYANIRWANIGHHLSMKERLLRPHDFIIAPKSGVESIITHHRTANPAFLHKTLMMEYSHYHCTLSNVKLWNAFSALLSLSVSLELSHPLLLDTWNKSSLECSNGNNRQQNTQYVQSLCGKFILTV